MHANKPSLHHALKLTQLHLAWEKVQENKGMAGVDGVELHTFAKKLNRRLMRLSELVSSKRYQPMPLRQCLIPKGHTSHFRQLAIPTVADRILQTAVCMVLNPVLDAAFANESFAYRPKRSVQDAIERIERLHREGYEWVVDADIDDFFDNIPHQPLLLELQPYTQDHALLELIQQWLQAPLLTLQGHLSERALGLPQGFNNITYSMPTFARIFHSRSRLPFYTGCLNFL